MDLNIILYSNEVFMSFSVTLCVSICLFLSFDLVSRFTQIDFNFSNTNTHLHTHNHSLIRIACTRNQTHTNIYSEMFCSLCFFFIHLSIGFAIPHRCIRFSTMIVLTCNKYCGFWTSKPLNMFGYVFLWPSVDHLYE